MSNFSRYKVLSNMRLILESYSGDTTVEDLIRQKTAISKEPDYDPTYNIIHDFRESNMLIEIENGKQFLEFLKNSKSIYHKRKVAHLTKTPDQVAKTTLFTLLQDRNSVEFEVFSTELSAFKWIGIDLNNFELIDSYLQEMKNIEQ
jgi:hypothetical protein